MIVEEDVHQALRMWHRDGSEGTPIGYLSLVHNLRRQGVSIGKATNQVLFDGLEALQLEVPNEAELLRQHFIDGQKMREIANQLNVGETMVFQIQKRAIKHLAQMLDKLEEQAIAHRKEELDKRLEPPTYYNLIGVEDHLKSLSEVLASSKAPCILSISGIGGIGKTSLADALLRRLICQSLFEDFGWVSAKQQQLNLGGGIRSLQRAALTVETLIEELVEQLLGFTPAQLSGKQAFELLRSHLKEKPYLIVIDNLETMFDIESLLPTLRRLANPSKFLLTSRESLFEEPNLYHFLMPPLNESKTLQLIRQEAKERNLPHLVEASDEHLIAIHHTVGGNPLAVRLVVGQTHIHDLSVILEDLKQARGERVESLYHHIYRRAWDNLDDLTRRLFLAMPLVTAQGGLLSHIAHITGLEPANVRNCLNFLVTLNLVDVRRDVAKSRYSIHNLTRTFLHQEVVKWQ